MKYLSIFFILTAFNSYAQNYSTLIVRHRQEYKEDFVKEKRSPLKENDLQYLQFFEPIVLIG